MFSIFVLLFKKKKKKNLDKFKAEKKQNRERWTGLLQQFVTRVYNYVAGICGNPNSSTNTPSLFFESLGMPSGMAGAEAASSK